MKMIQTERDPIKAVDNYQAMDNAECEVTRQVNALMPDYDVLYLSNKLITLFYDKDITDEKIDAIQEKMDEIIKSLKKIQLLRTYVRLLQVKKKKEQAKYAAL